MPSRFVIFASLFAVGTAFAVSPSPDCQIAIDFNDVVGKVKPVHATGQGPLLGWNDFSLFRHLKEANIPYVRLHDVGGPFGKNVYVDIPNIFRDFDADENDPVSYDFTFTDIYLKALVANGVEPYFRLGVTIENASRTVKPYRTCPPKDFAKWARVCEHIVRHYNEGWANGFWMNITYWEIWNEADDFPDHRNAMWRGTWRQYCELYDITAKHLKANFPNIKVGGYARCTAYSVNARLEGNPQPKDEVYRDKCFDEFLAFIQERKSPLDFFSYHGYIQANMVGPHADFHRAALDKAGYPNAELHLNEWLNYSGREYYWTNPQLAAAMGSFLVALQESKTDAAMVYDARCAANPYSPLFDPIKKRPSKGFWPFKAFGELYRLGTEVKVALADGQGTNGLWAVAAKGAGEAAALVVNTLDKARPFVCDFGGRGVSTCRIVDATRDYAECALPVELPPNSCLFIVFNRETRPVRLEAERRADPVGLDVVSPRLSWKVDFEGEQGVRETAYEIQAASSREKLLAGEADRWASGVVKGARGSTVRYAGAAPKTSETIWWRVRVETEAEGRGPVWSEWSEPAFWTAGVMAAADWKAKWIGPAPETRPDDPAFAATEWQMLTGTNLTATATFTYTPVSSSASPSYLELGFAATGKYTIFLNGRMVERTWGEFFPWSNRVARFVDLTPAVKPGENVIVVKLGKPGDAFRLSLNAVNLPGVSGLSAFSNVTTSLIDESTNRRIEEFSPMMRRELVSPAFAKSFMLDEVPVKAVLHITGLGFYEASMNGRRIGDKVLDPTPSAYEKRVYYSTYDVRELLVRGDNELKVLVGHGWYDVRTCAVWNFDCAKWRDFPRMIAQLELTMADGSQRLVVSDDSWRHVASPVGYDCIREGEVIGAAHPQAASLLAKGLHAVEVPAPKGTLQAEMLPGAKVCERFRPTSVREVGEGVWLVSFPECIAGWIDWRVRRQPKGTVLRIRYDDRLGEDGGPVPDGKRHIDVHVKYMASHPVMPWGAFQTDRFVCDGSGEERYCPRFTYNGFQYVRIAGYVGDLNPDDIVACAVQTDFPTTGSFECSDKTFNALMKINDRAYRSNFTDGYPTDCPHREKNGWTGDASIACELGQLIYDNAPAYEKWMRDLADAQQPNGIVPSIVPGSGWGQWGGGPAWGSAYATVLWDLRRYWGDTQVAKELLGSLERQIEGMKAGVKDSLLDIGHGDWVPVNMDHFPEKGYVLSCYYMQLQLILAEFKREFGFAEAAEKWTASALRTRDAIIRKYHKGDGVWDNGLQTAESVALAFGLADVAGVRAETEAKLVKAVEDAGRHVDVGLIGLKWISRVLSEAGRTDLAFEQLTNPTWPSPAWWIQQGATACWENWKGTSSRNHIMFGDYAAWAYCYLAGIRPLHAGKAVALPDKSTCGMTEFLIAPQPIAALDWVKASVEVPRGTIRVSWKREANRFVLEVDVPANCTAHVILPSGEKHVVSAGHHVFKEKCE